MLQTLAMVMCCLMSAATAQAFTMPAQTQQLVLAVATDIDTSQVTLRRFERPDPSTTWTQVGTASSARIGKRGLAWGRGAHGDMATPFPTKREGDWRAPAGIFRIGDAYGDAAQAPGRTTWTYHQVTARDLWVEDASAPTYNQHILVPADRPLTEWEESQRMKLGDPAHRLKIVIHHNAAPAAVAGAGSAIFFHIWRKDGAVPTSGCTAMAAADLEALLGWLQPGAHPLYVLLDQATYAQHRAAWGLP